MSELHEHYRALLGLDDSWKVDDLDLDLDLAASQVVTPELASGSKPILNALDKAGR